MVFVAPVWCSAKHVLVQRPTIHHPLVVYDITSGRDVPLALCVSEMVNHTHSILEQAG